MLIWCWAKSMGPAGSRSVGTWSVVLLSCLFQFTVRHAIVIRQSSISLTDFVLSAIWRWEETKSLPRFLWSGGQAGESSQATEPGIDRPTGSKAQPSTIGRRHYDSSPWKIGHFCIHWVLWLSFSPMSLDLASLHKSLRPGRSSSLFPWLLITM